MVQQKIVMKVEMSSEKRRTQILKIAAVEKGVTKVSIQPEKDQVEVIGDGVDSTCLTMSLRKKLKFVEIVSIEEVKPGDAKPAEGKKPAEASVIPITSWTSSYNYVHYPQIPIHHYQVVHDEQPSCSIM